MNKAENHNYKTFTIHFHIILHSSARDGTFFLFTLATSPPRKTGKEAPLSQLANLQNGITFQYQSSLEIEIHLNDIAHSNLIDIVNYVFVV